MEKTSTRDEVVASIVAALNARDANSIRPLLMPDVLMEYPYSPSGYVQSVLGVDEVIKCLDRVLAGFARFALKVSHEYSGPDGVLMEARSEAERIDGTVYANQYVLVWEFAGGLVQVWREYFDPRKLQAASGIRIV